VLEASRAHLEMYRSSMEERGLVDGGAGARRWRSGGSSMEERGLAASTIDRRLSTACGY
jgi:hypothetical protein